MNSQLVLSPEEAALLVSKINMIGKQTPECNSLYLRLQQHAKLVPAPLNGDKVWVGLTTGLVKITNNGNQAKTVVRAKTKTQAIQILAATFSLRRTVTMHEFNTYWSVTGNVEHLAMATEKGVWASGDEGWVKVWPKS